MAKEKKAKKPSAKELFTPEQLLERKKFIKKAALIMLIFSVVMIGVSLAIHFGTGQKIFDPEVIDPGFDFKPIWAPIPMQMANKTMNSLLISMVIVVAVSGVLSTYFLFYYKKVKKQVANGTYLSKEQRKAKREAKKAGKPVPEFKMEEKAETTNNADYLKDLKKI